MVAITVILILIGIYYYLDAPRRQIHEQEVEDRTRLRIKNQDHRITYIELAKQFRDLTTARNMIALNLVKEGPDPDDTYVKLIYEGYFTDENNCRDNYRARFIGNQFGLLPSAAGYVGSTPNDPNRRAAA